VNKIDQVANDPQIKARDMLIEIQHPEAGAFKVVNTPFKFSRTPYKPEHAAPDLGANTQDVLVNMAGLSQEEITELKKLRVV